MTKAGEPEDHGQQGKTGDPGDVPAERPLPLASLDALIGEWEMEAWFDAGYFGQGSPPVTERAGPAPGTFSQHYYDSRGVARVYEMSLDDGIWKLWREAPGFWQRYAGAFAADGKTAPGIGRWMVRSGSTTSA